MIKCMSQDRRRERSRDPPFVGADCESKPCEKRESKDVCCLNTRTVSFTVCGLSQDCSFVCTSWRTMLPWQWADVNLRIHSVVKPLFTRCVDLGLPSFLFSTGECSCIFHCRVEWAFIPFSRLCVMWLVLHWLIFRFRSSLCQYL